MDQQSARQLDVLRKIDGILTRGRMRFWLRGGWGVDFLLGRVTRPHADLDLVTWQRHRQRIHRELLAAGFVLDRELSVQTDFIKDGQDVTFVFLDRAADGTLTGHGVPEWVWEPGALPARQQRLDDICARVVAPEHMLRDLEEWEAATGRPPRPKDARTVVILRDLVARSAGS